VARHVVIGTAGHIDHGKTTLVKALTGVDTDRLAEEKERGITIDLGFAPLELGEADTAAGVVDVPGHEAFIRNMVAGAAGVDLALLVVAADEGVMPQTREHLAILRFLGVSRGVVALTKCDLATDREWRALVSEDVSGEVERVFGASWPVVEVAAATGEGLDRLLACLGAEAAEVGLRSRDDRFRLPVDRVFALPGAGTIVTGTTWSGVVCEGDHVTVLPGGKRARVRSIQVHGQNAASAGPAQRTALALVGVSREDVRRGSAVVGGDGWREGRVLDLDVALLPEVGLKPRQRVRFHLGTSEAVGRLLRIGRSGGALTARIVLEHDVVARAGDRFVLRSWSPVTTIGGGLVLDPWADEHARSRGKACPPRPAGEGELVVQLIRSRGRAGMAREAMEVAAGLPVTRLTALLEAASDLGVRQAEGRWFDAELAAHAAGRMLEALRRFHAVNPLEPGMSAQALRASAGGFHPALVGLAEGDLLASGEVVREGSLVRLKGFAPGLGGAAKGLQEQVLGLLREADAEPPSVVEIKERFPGAEVGGVLRLLARSGAVVAVSPDRYYAAEAFKRETDRLVGVLSELGAATPAALRNRLGRSRKWLIPLLEWADREGLTIREGDSRRLAPGRGA
jgi:selenocysteine-specific elongation factor